MSKIKQLSSNTINQISAGEVIERPASVIKELVENSLDAGATRIDIHVERAGKNLIIIHDNGHGMNDVDLDLAVERHTTSKLDEANLAMINYFGFRGEALPSIGSISRLTITTKDKSSPSPYKLSIEGGVRGKINDSILNNGTKIEVRDLFFATPARLKFLKTDQTELAACVEIVKKLALAHPNISFTLTSGDKTLLKTRALELQDEEKYKYRIAEILGESFIDNSVKVDHTNGVYKIHGYISLPTLHKAGGQDQYLLVNNRPVRDKLFFTAIRIAYQDYIARDRFPIAVLYLTMDPQYVDVNVHPTKAEVNFHDSNGVRNAFIDAIRNALSKGVGFKASSTIAEQTINSFKTAPYQASTTYNPANIGLNNSDYDKNSNFFEDKSSFRNMANFNKEYYSLNNNKVIKNIPIHNQQMHLLDSSKSVDINDLQSFTSFSPQVKTYNAVDNQSTDSIANNSNLDEKYVDFPLGAACAHLHENYIIAQTKDSVVIVDQHAAHERLLYEQLKKSLEVTGLVKQRLLIPEVVELDDQFLTDNVGNYAEQLAKFGLNINKIGEKSILVTETPALLDKIDVQQLIKDLADNLHEEGTEITLTKLIEAVTETYACHQAIRSGKKLGMTEANALLRQMEATPFSGQCNHGRPTYIELKLKDIEKLFGRR